MPVLINLKNVNSNDTKQLFQFFADQTKIGIKVWKKNTTYFFQNGTAFTFKNDVFQRERKDKRIGVRYELISNKPPIGEGTFAKVRKIKGTVALDEGFLSYKKEGKEGSRRVVKIQNHNDNTLSLADLQTEYELSKRASHLSIKKPTVCIESSENQKSYTVMRLIPGKELLEILNEVDLTTEQRIELSMALLKALKKQVKDNHIVHRDIKPENILVDLGQPIVVTIIDYGLSMDADNPDHAAKGTQLYCAPEIRHNRQANYKADVFSMARVIALLWKVDGLTYKNDNKFLQYATPRRLIRNIFQNINELDDQMKRSISSTLIGMLQTKPARRFSIEEAIHSFLPGKEIACFSEPLFSFFTSSPIVPKVEEVLINSCFSELQIAKIRDHIKQLQTEVASSWPYPNKDRKLLKIEGLKALLELSTKTTSAEDALEQLEKMGLYPDFQSGAISARTKNLVDELLGKSATSSYGWGKALFSKCY